jgi:formate/nitrite transporter FocA (FNT family)
MVRDQGRSLAARVGCDVLVGVATWLGIMAGMIAKVVIAFVMVGLFVVALVF